MADLAKTSNLMRLILDQDAEEREVRRALAASVQSALENDYEVGKDQYVGALRLAKIHQAQIDILYGHLGAADPSALDDGWASAPRVDTAEATTTTSNADGSTTTETRRVTRVEPMSGTPAELRRDPEWLGRMAMVRTLLSSGENISRIHVATGISMPTIRKERKRLESQERDRTKRRAARAVKVTTAEVTDDDGFE